MQEMHPLAEDHVDLTVFNLVKIILPNPILIVMMITADISPVLQLSGQLIII